MRYCSIVLVLLYGSGLYGQNIIPHPYVFGGPEGMGGGYAPLAWVGAGGFRIDSQHFIVDAYGEYDNGHKVNDNDQPNPNGHDRGLVGSAYYRLPAGWAVGAGARWSELSTTNYNKSAWRPTFGGSKDYFGNHCQEQNCAGEFTMRMGVDYVLPGTDWQNRSQGPLFSLYIPSPAVQAHIFYRETVGIYRFHETVTAPTDAALTSQQLADHGFDAFAEFTLMFRF